MPWVEEGKYKLEIEKNGIKGPIEIFASNDMTLFGDIEQEVYLAEHTISNEKFAIKYLKAPGNDKQENILREITNLAGLNHPNIIKYYNSFFDYKR